MTPLPFEIALTSYADWGLLALRVVLAVIFLVHCKNKILKPAGMAQSMGWSKAAVVLLGFAELLGGLYVLTGFYAQSGAALISLVMLGALYHKIFKWKVPFTAQDKMGWEFDLLILGGALVVMTGGIGAFVVV
jgi:putative oxidoreductase